ncbi:protein of unknown function (DUF1996) domain containing protein [Lactarius tabidus]
MIVSLLTIGLLLLPSTKAFWRLPCAKPVINGRIDPIVAPGKASSHAHTIMGSSAIGYSTTFDDLTSSDCTTCMVNDDKSAYWIPVLYYQYPNGSFVAVDHGGLIVYYLPRGGSNETVQPFPDGLRMLTGNPYARNYTGTDASKAISWLCIDNGPAQAQTPGFTDTNCPNGLRGQVFFPSCWDGVNLDSPDHQSHVAYPSGIDSGSCPSSHPVHFVSIFYESWFNVVPFTNQGGQFVLANGDPTGYGLHGDFMNGWNKDVLGRAIETCTDGSGVIENCPVFANENRFVSDDEMNACAAPNPKPSEDVQGPMQYLPGCVAVTKGPAPATAANLDPGCVSGSGNPAPASSSPQNTSSSSIPASSPPANPSPSTSPAAGDGSVPNSSSSMLASSSPTSPPPNTTPAPGDGTVPGSSSSVPTYSSPAGPSQNTMPAPGGDSVPSSSSSMPASSSPAGPPQNTVPGSGDDSGPGSSTSTPLPTQPPPANAGPSPSSSTPAPPSVASPNPTTSNTPAANPPSGSNPYDGNGNASPSPNSSPASGGPSSMNPGPVPPTTSTVQPSSTPSNESAPPSSSSSSSGNYNGHHGHKHHGHHSQQQQQQDDDNDEGYCTGRPKKRAAKKRSGDTRRPMRRRHHARRAGHDSHMYL